MIHDAPLLIACANSPARKPVYDTMQKLLIYIFMALLAAQNSRAQAVDNNGIERNINKESCIRLNYGNDYFTATDYYLTQSILLELTHPALKKNPVTLILLQPATWQVKYGLAAEHNGYTPTDYVPAHILYGDRPFAGTLSLKSFTIATDTFHKQRWASALSIGVIGPWAGAGDMQTYIHEHTPNALPQGWPNQVANDLLLNYQLSYEKQVLQLGQYGHISATASAKAGTVTTKVNGGLTFMAGLFNNPYASFRIRNKRIQLYIYDHPEINFVAYDATLQGGLFNKQSPYTLTSSEISRAVFRNNWGIVAKLGNVYLEYYQSYMTKEFQTGLEMRNGGIQIGVGL
ncbi:MAG TPA: lipid A deacylase LpxR family protein [Chitinophagaceae bacterium]|nr:lipid A deacylase LpxR family protein [Chitinophagaceae bacterium]